MSTGDQQQQMLVLCCLQWWLFTCFWTDFWRKMRLLGNWVVRVELGEEMLKIVWPSTSESKGGTLLELQVLFKKDIYILVGNSLCHFVSKYEKKSVSLNSMNWRCKWQYSITHLLPRDDIFINICSVMEFQRWWVLKSKLFGQESTYHQGKIFKKIQWVMTVCQKVPKLYFQS